MNIATVLAGHTDPNRPALIHDGSIETYAELVDNVGRAHHALVELGVRPDARVALLAGTKPMFVHALFGALSAGAVVIPLNPLCPPAEMQSNLDAVEPDIVLVAPSAAASASQCTVRGTLVALGGAELDGAVRFEDIAAPVDRPAMVDRSGDDLALLLFTSGTAGSPKPAMLTHGNLLANIEQLDALDTRLITPEDVVLGAVPLFHILGLNMLLGVTLRNGAAVVLMPRFDAATALGLLDRHQVTVVTGPPTMWQAWADLPDVEPRHFAHLRRAVSGAAPLTQDVANRVEERLGVRLSQGYGLTEAAPILTTSAGLAAPPTSVGRPVPGVTLRLVDNRGNDVPVGDEGEIWAKGPNIFPGYLDDPAATAAALTPDGWLRTGDLGVVDDDGFLYIVNRNKDLIVVSGFNVFPGEVEIVLRAHPGIEAAAVIGVPHPSSGETVKAVVVPLPGVELDEDEVIAFCGNHLARYKCPTVVELATELPMAESGKLRRRELRGLPGE